MTIDMSVCNFLFKKKAFARKSETVYNTAWWDNDLNIWDGYIYR